jgi:ISXO2-like transposase domain
LNALIVHLNTLLDSENTTFTDTTNTVLYRTRKGDEWITFVDCMFKGYSLRKSAEIVEVTWVTLFYWRHKLLNALKQMDFEQFEGIVEVDDTYFLYSQKGQRGITERKPRKRGGKSKHRGISHEQVCILVARNRTKATVSKVACMGRVVKTKVDNLIGSKLTTENVLVTDAWRAYKTKTRGRFFCLYLSKQQNRPVFIRFIHQLLLGVVHILPPLLALTTSGHRTYLTARTATFTLIVFFDH